MKANIILLVMSAVLAAAYMVPVVGAAGAVIGTASVHAPAVIVLNNSGTLTTITLTVTRGTGNVSVIGPSSVASSTLDSAKTAVQYATGSLGVNQSNYNFTYEIADFNTSVSGPSAGAAMTLLAVSALTHRQINSNITLTGTISPNGTVGPIGGVYDKMGAAAALGIKYAFVPYVPNGTSENELYYLVQQRFALPLVQVQNMSQLEAYALNQSFNPYTRMTNYSVYTDYHVGSIQNASISCSNDCNTQGFNYLTNQTIALSKAEIGTLSQDSRFSSLANNMMAMLNQSKQIAGKGYKYLGDDIAFLTYIDAYYFNHNSVSRSSGKAVIQNVSNYCTSIIQPQLTSGNYEYILGGELRQTWGEYTANSTLSFYNSTLDSDQVLSDVGLAGEASGWCTAAQYMYDAASNSTGPAMAFNSTELKPIAYKYLSAAKNYSSSMYYITANNAYSEGNYALATMDAAYAIGLDSVPQSNASASSIASEASALLDSSNYGVWATQYSNEAKFYISEVQMSNNQSSALGYAYSAYTTAMLAHEVSAATAAISSSMIPAPAAPQPSYTGNSALIGAVAAIAIIALIISLIALYAAMHAHSMAKPRRGRPPKAGRKNR